jgi:hypothetical protein
VRTTLLRLGCVLCALGGTTLANAEPSDLVPTLTCRPEAMPGRVSCELEVETSKGRLVWVDALVVRAPDFAPPLRARVGQIAAVGVTERRARLPIVLAAIRAGRGKLEVEARTVVCVDGADRRGACRPWSKRLEAKVEVGAEPH